MKLSVIGCGYLGAVHAAAMAELGHDVIGIDVDPGKIEQLRGRHGRRSSSRACPRCSPRPSRPAGCASRPTSRMPADATVHFVAVGTPQSRDGNAADLRYVDAAIEALLPHLKAGDLVVGKSTVPVGTAAASRRPLAEAGIGRPAGVEPRVPARGLRREGHDRARPARLRRRRTTARTSTCSTRSTRSAIASARLAS